MTHAIADAKKSRSSVTHILPTYAGHEFHTSSVPSDGSLDLDNSSITSLERHYAAEDIFPLIVEVRRLTGDDVCTVGSDVIPVAKTMSFPELKEYIKSYYLLGAHSRVSLLGSNDWQENEEVDRVTAFGSRSWPHPRDLADGEVMLSSTNVGIVLRALDRRGSVDSLLVHIV